MLLAAAAGAREASEKLPLTAAERSDYKATSRYSEVMEFCETLMAISPLVRLGEMGTTVEGRSIPLVILSDPPVATPEEAAKTGKPVVFVNANIHAGEVDAKEGALMLARDLATGKEPRLLKELVVVIAPIFNADGNERMRKTNRPGQVGPEEGMGVRPNAQGLDLNRDFVKLESPEVRALVRLFTRWDPAVFVDGHTTDGSFHRYTLTYEGIRIPAGDPKLITYVRDEMLPDVGRRLKEHTGFLSYFYGNFSRDRTRWETVPATARYGTLYMGLRNRIGILSESYSYASFKDRIIASREFFRSILEFVADHKDQVQGLLKQAREQTVKEGQEPKASGQIALREKPVPLPDTHQLLGFVEETKDGRRRPTKELKEYEVRYDGGTEPTLTVRRPYAYLLPASFGRVVENLKRHGIGVEELREDIELDVEVYRIGVIKRLARPFQNHRTVEVDATARKETRRLPAGTILVRAAQPLGTLAAYLLEPQSEDGLCTWNFFDEALKEGEDFPVIRLPEPTRLTYGTARPLAEDRTVNKRITADMVLGTTPAPNLFGNPVTGLTWLEDGQHFLQRQDGKLYRVDAATGRSRIEPARDPSAVAKALKAVPGLDPKTATAIAGRVAAVAVGAKQKGDVFLEGNEVYYFAYDGSHAARLTKSGGKKELLSLSPDGKTAAFVRDGNLFVVDVVSQKEIALTSDGSANVSNGKADWVYFEEIFHRNPKAYWWGPDSREIAFVRYDDTPVRRFTVIDEIPVRQNVESTAYPKAGTANPTARAGVAPVEGGPVRWLDLSDYPPASTLVVRLGFVPDGRRVYCYLQDRAQTWLDLCTAPLEGGRPTRLFRETTKAWVDDPGEPRFLKDGSFLLASERTGWRHYYHFAPDGPLLGPVTSGEWEARAINHVDEDGGWVYVSGTRDSAIGSNLYRAKLDGSDIQRLTLAPGTHAVSFSPDGNFFLDTWSNHRTAAQVRLCRADGTPVRAVDTNPVYALEEYRLGRYELVQIRTPDGFLIEGSLLYPPDFDPHKKYPVWFQTYGGPHAPMVHDVWMGGRLRDQALADMGVIVFWADPRSASGKGACSTWTAYRQLGVQELKDIETAVGWLTARPYVDASRVGMSGHSYGGFMTAFCLTHSKLFAAGIAGAPVTDWHNYDTIYTERYMNTPQDNPKGYEVTSVVKAAKDLHGRLLILHGVMDDNVHMQNTLQLVQALQAADRPFEVMFYPHSRHGIMGRAYQRLIFEFIRRSLHLDAPETSGAAGG